MPNYLCYLTFYVLSSIFNVVNCQWGAWREGVCDKDCGGGHITRIRIPTVEAQHGGQECSGDTTETESCNVQECPGY